MSSRGTGRLKVTCDVGGTFTDVAVSGERLPVRIGKSLTTPGNLVDGLLAAIEAVASPAGERCADLLARTDLFVFSTTQATNAILQRTTARTALLCTRGFPDILVRREGGSMHPYDFTRPYPEPYVPRDLTFEIDERIGADGSVVVPLDLAQAERVVGALRAHEVEAVAVSLLWSVANGAHERAIGELCARVLPGVPVTLSHVLNPILREYRRTSGAAIDASLKPAMQRHLASVEVGLRDAGLRGQLLAATSMGGVLPIGALSERPIYAAKSGPSLAPVAARLYARHERGAADAIVCDAGGTSFDVSLVRSGEIAFTRDTWLGDVFTGHHTGLASVDVRSIGAGGGSIAWVDGGGLLRVGPRSAGSDPGPACYGRGGTEPTVTDAACVLGYLDPAGLLGGALAMDARAATVVLRDLGEDLGLDARESAAAVITLAAEHMVGAIREITINQGTDPRDVLVVAGGGAAGLMIAAIGQTLGSREVLVPRTAGALSACGGQYSEIVYEAGAMVATSTADFAFAAVAAAFAEIDEELDSFEARVGATALASRRERRVEARYINQAWTLDLKIGSEGIPTAGAVRATAARFHDLHERTFAVSDPGEVVEILQCRGRLVGTPYMPPLPVAPHPGVPVCEPAFRTAYFSGFGELPVPLLRGAGLSPGASYEGPLLVVEPTTTIVVPPTARLRVTSLGNYLLELR